MNTQLTKYLTLFLFSFITVIIYAQKIQPSINARETCQQLIDDAREDSDNKNYAVALEKLLKAELMAEENQWNDLLSHIKNRIGTIYTYLSSFGEALEYYQESFSIAQQNSELYEKASSPLANIGLLYAREKKYEDALYYFIKAYNLVKDTDDALKKHIAVLMANVYNRTNQPEKSFEILNETKEDVDNSVINFIWKAAYIDALYTKGEVIKAENEAKQLYAELNDGKYKDPRQACYSCLVEIMSNIYIELNQIDLALTYIKDGLQKTDELTSRIELYEKISDLYLEKAQYALSLQYKDSVVLAKDSLSIIINRNLYEANKAKFRVQEYQNDLLNEKERKKAQQYIFTGTTVLGLFIFFVVYRTLKNNAYKQKQKAVIADLELEKERKEHQILEQKKLLVEKELETSKLKQSQLKHEIAKKNRELTSKTLYLSSRNELIRDVVNSTQGKDASEKVKIIKNFLKTDPHWNDFFKHFESVNPNFLKRLKEKHPRLTSNDTRFLCYVYMNLSIKEISMVFNITYNTCVIRKQRIMDKMGLDKKKTSLYDYVLNISQNLE
ncbi:MAG: tetratricopeptide repeat protein [Moheibacter sp.]